MYRSRLMQTCLPLALGLASVTASAGNAHKLVFEKPLTLTKQGISVSVEKVKLHFDRSCNQWKESSVSKDTRSCNLTIKVEGRDLAIKNRALSEHYFGTMQLSCKKNWGDLFGNDFTTNFSRVLFLGLRNCVESE